MPNLSDTIARLSRLGGAGSGGGVLTELTGFGSNPGTLRGWLHLPEDPARVRALVVVLHGCTQTAAGYDSGAGWSAMADTYGFAVLFPEQQRQNNPNLCFNWFTPEDNRRDRGEAFSIRQMIAAVQAQHAIPNGQVFVTGLSAGGAMAAVMLSAYPEVFAGGAIIAGLPYGSASGVPQAMDRMRGKGLPDEAELAALVRRASAHTGPWPILSVWHGSADATVHPGNATAIVAQWRALHGADPQPTRSGTVDGHAHRTWCDAAGRAVIEEYSIAGMGHGTPLATGGADGCGTAGPYMLESNISSTRHICRFWGLTGAAEGKRVEAPRRPQPEATPAARPVPALVAEPAAWAPTGPTRRHAERITPQAAPAAGVGKVIEDALRAAGLMR